MSIHNPLTMESEAFTSIELSEELESVVKEKYKTWVTSHGSESYPYTLVCVFGTNGKMNFTVNHQWFEQCEDGELAKYILKVVRSTKIAPFKNVPMGVGKMHLSVPEQTYTTPVVASLSEFFDMSQTVDISCCPRDRMSLSLAIIHFNDKHRWTREQIADWLEESDLDIQVKQ